MSTIIDANGHLSASGRAYTLTADASRQWGAYESPGVDSSEAAAFRNAIRRALMALAVEKQLPSIEVYADGAPVDAQSWMLEVVTDDR